MKISKKPTLFELCHVIESSNHTGRAARPLSAVGRPSLASMSDLRFANRPRPRSATPSKRPPPAQMSPVPSTPQSSVAVAAGRSTRPDYAASIAVEAPDARADAIDVPATTGSSDTAGESALTRQAAQTRAELFRIRSRVHQALRDSRYHASQHNADAANSHERSRTAPFLVASSEMREYVSLLQEHLTNCKWEQHQVDRIIKDLDIFFESTSNDRVNLWTFGPTDRSVYEAEPTDFAEKLIGNRAASALRQVTAKVSAAHDRLTRLFRSLSDEIFIAI